MIDEGNVIVSDTTGRQQKGMKNCIRKEEKQQSFWQE